MPKLTITEIEAAQPGASDVWLWDTDVRGFGVRVQPSGRKTYVVQYRNRHGRQRRVTIARTSDMPPRQARDQARMLFAEIARGDDPAERRRADRGAVTIAELKQRYMDEYANVYKKPRSAKMDGYLWKNRILPAMGKTAVTSVTTRDIQALHSRMRHIPTSANHVVSLFSAAFKFAASVGLVDHGHNPARGVKKYQLRGRETILNQQQIAALLAEIQRPRYPDGFRVFIRLLLLTGCRKSEILNARTEWVDFDRRILALPDTKTGPRNVQLSEPALDILRSLRSQKHVCRGLRRDRPLKSVERYWKEAVTNCGLIGVRLHDLRHTVGSLGHRAGLSQREIADLLGHKKMSTTARYIHGTDTRAADIVAGVVMPGW